MTDPTKDHKWVSPEGRAMGEQLVRVTEPRINALAAEGEPDERCKSCAFTSGTVPNGCLQTQMDALKAVVEKVPFNCHQHDRKGHGCECFQPGEQVQPARCDLRAAPPPR